jgi:hypothetical protein
MTAIVLTAVLASAAPVAREAVQFEKRVSAARAKAIDFLKKQQNKDGIWEGKAIEFLAGMDGGTTALATLSLLETGVKPDDAAIAKAVDYLVKLQSKKTYVVSLQTQVLARVDAKKHAKLIQANADWLLANAIKANNKLVGWSYPINDIADGSNTHFAVMGLHAAAQAGATIDNKVWTQIRDFYVKTQRNEGWAYYSDAKQPTTVSMTGCGALGLAVTAMHDKNAKKPDADFDKAMAAYLPIWTLSSPKSTFYNMMVVAELGRVLGVTEFKSGDEVKAWYHEGAVKLMKEQHEDGSFASGTKSVDGNAIFGTAFGLYFLGPPAKK